MTDALFDAYMKFNEELAKAGVLVVSGGLNPAGPRARIEARRRLLRHRGEVEGRGCSVGDAVPGRHGQRRRARGAPAHRRGRPAAGPARPREENRADVGEDVRRLSGSGRPREGAASRWSRCAMLWLRRMVAEELLCRDGGLCVYGITPPKLAPPLESLAARKNLPVGLNVESVSIRKAEFEGAAELFRRLKARLRRREQAVER